MLEGGETMELVRGITHVVMDKTGTLTQGTPQVTDMKIGSRWEGQENVLSVLICAIEEANIAAHPLASAIFKKLLPICGELWIDYRSSGGLKDVKETGGRGIQARVKSCASDWMQICVGSLEYMRDNGVKAIESMPSQLDGKGSMVFVAVNGELAASIVLQVSEGALLVAQDAADVAQDTIRRDAKATIDALKVRSIQVSMLTGDNAAEASRISQHLGIPVTASCATPEMKLKHIKKLQDDGHKVMMV